MKENTEPMNTLEFDTTAEDFAGDFRKKIESEILNALLLPEHAMPPQEEIYAADVINSIQKASDAIEQDALAFWHALAKECGFDLKRGDFVFVNLAYKDELPLIPKSLKSQFHLSDQMPDEQAIWFSKAVFVDPVKPWGAW